MNNFDALIHSLGEHVVDTIGKDHLERVLIAGDGQAETAEITIELSEQTWEEQARAIDKMIDLRELFLSDISFEYRFVEEDELGQSADARANQLSFA